MNSLILSRVPIIVLSYWVIKIASTTLGETGADYFSYTLNLGYAIVSLLFLAVFFVFLTIKLMLKTYNPITYWLVFTSTSIVGTAISDFIDRSLGWICWWCSYFDYRIIDNIVFMVSQRKINRHRYNYYNACRNFLLDCIFICKYAWYSGRRLLG